MKKAIYSFIVMMLLISMVGCAGSGSNEKSEVENEQEKATGKAPKGEKTGRVGVSMPTKSSERWIRDSEGIKEGLEALGYEVDLQFAEDHVDVQVSQIENMLMQGVDALVIAAIDGATLTTVCNMAREQGVVIIAYDRLIMNTEAVDYFATFDSTAIGKLQGGYIVEKLGLKEGKGPFNVEIFAGSLDDSNTPFYYEGAMMELQPYIDNGMVVVKSAQVNLNQVATQNWDGQIAQARMDNILTAFYADGSKVDAVVSPYDGLSLGILSALKGIGYGAEDLPYPIISGQDCEIPSIKSIIAGEQAQSVFVDTRELSKVAVKLVDETLKNGVAEVNRLEAYDNSVKKVSAMAISATSVDIDNYEEVLIGSNYYTEEDLK
ncbi:MAG: sugar ABC transporter substrate-binding protein [Firmicutes bacterium HGW-Firmicutes-7]|nr:MAG: sugar ABC transporter substrate-binding protein [Firmicutes bacterium HGW-Firmicutes-7]